MDSKKKNEITPKIKLLKENNFKIQQIEAIVPKLTAAQNKYKQKADNNNSWNLSTIQKLFWGTPARRNSEPSTRSSTSFTGSN